MKSCLLVSTYNWKEALSLVLKSINAQTQFPDEILIADDGSAADTRQLIDNFAQKINIPVKHFWQEDKGFRKSAILNKAIAGTDADYIIQIDGDCILHPNFVQDHLKNAVKTVYLYGSRVNILPNFVAKVLENQLISFHWYSKEIKNKTRSLRIPFLSKIYKPHSGISSKFRGCNVSFWRDDFLKVNGYNEDFEGWGREDSDMVIRMGNAGVLAKRLRYAGIVFHIHHKVSSKHNFGKNDEIQNQTIEKRIVQISNGVDKYLKNNH